MNDIIKKIEAAQLKAEVPEFRVGDTVKVYAKIKEGTEKEHRHLKELLLRDRTVALERHLQFVSSLTESE